MVMTLRELDDCLPDRVGGQDLDKFTTVNRPLLMRHALNILDFMKLNEDWILGNFTISAKPNEINWDQDKRILTVENRELFIIDGQHRRRAIAELLHELQADLNQAKNLEKTEAQQVLVTLYVCQHERDMRQLFAWMAKNKTRRDQHPRNLRLIRPVEQRRAGHPGRHRPPEGPHQPQQSRARKKRRVPVNEQPPEKQRARDDPREQGPRATKGLIQHHRQDGPQTEITLNCKGFYDKFLPECHEIFSKIKAGGIVNAELPHIRQNNWLLEPLLIRLLADCYGQIKKTNADQEALIEHIACHERGPSQHQKRHSRAKPHRPG